MATLCTFQNTNWTTTNGFDVVDTTSYNWSTAANTLLTTAYVASTTFIPGAITVDAVGIFVVSITPTSPSGTMSMQLFNSTDSLVVATVDINVSDLQPRSVTSATTVEIVLFKFTATTLIAGKSYSIRLKTSVANQVNCYSLATTNWSRFLRTTTTGTIAAGDTVFICGEKTGAGASTPYTVTMDNNNATVFGPIGIGSGGTLNWSNSANTELRVNGDLTVTGAGGTIIVAGGIYRQGTQASRIPSSFTSTLYFSSAAAAGGGLYYYNNSEVTIAGAVRTSDRTFLTANAAAAATSVTIDNVGYNTSDWAVGDEIVIAGTERVVSQNEKRTITSITGSGTILNFTGGLSFLHTGTGSFPACVINLTRNVKITAPSTTLTYSIGGNNYFGKFLLDSVEVKNIGSVTANRQGIRFVLEANPSYYFTVTNCGFHLGHASSKFIENTTTAQQLSYINITNNVMHSCGIAFIAFTQPTSQFDLAVGSSIDNNVFMTNQTGSAAIVISATIPCTNNKVYSSNAVFSYGFQADNRNESSTFSGNLAHSSQYFLMALTNNDKNGTVCENNTNVNGTYGFISYTSKFSTMKNCISLGAVNAGFVLGNGTSSGYGNRKFTLLNGSANSYGAFTTPYGIRVNIAASLTPFNEVYFQNMSFGTTAVHTLGDIIPNNADYTVGCNIYFNDCNFGSTNFIVSRNFMDYGSNLSFQRLNGSANDHRTYQRDQITYSDTSVFNKGAISAKIEPLIATYKSLSYPKRKPVKNGVATTISVSVRKAATYNGAQPRLWVRANSALGLDVDTLLATMSVGVSTWENLTATLPTATAAGAWEFYIDCDGTAGNINIDSWK